MTDDPFDPLSDPLSDARLDALLRDAARTYNRPPDFPANEALWAEIERALPPADAMPLRPRLAVVRDDIRGDVVPNRSRWASPWLRAAAVLLLGVALGRASTRLDLGRAATRTTASATRATTSDTTSTSALPGADAVATNEYLGRTQALLATLPAELQARRADPAYLSRADALLLQTRLLLDSPAAADPTLRSLFDDLEIVLAQVVRLKADRDPTRVDFLNQALEQRDVLPRLRDAVADNAGD